MKYGIKILLFSKNKNIKQVNTVCMINLFEQLKPLGFLKKTFIKSIKPVIIKKVEIYKIKFRWISFILLNRIVESTLLIKIDIPLVVGVLSLNETLDLKI